MLPPIDEAVLESNPKFAVLYTILKTKTLNPTGSTKAHPAQRERDATTEALKAARIRTAKKELLKTALSSLDLAPPAIRTSKSPTVFTPLPPELLQLILLLSARLTNPPSPPSTHLLESTAQWATLTTQLPAIGGLISTYLHNQALAIARIQSPSTNASYLHRAIPKMVGNTIELKEEVCRRKDDLRKRRIALVGKTTTVLSITHLTTTLIIRILEQTRHGAVSRHIKSKAEFLSGSAEQVLLEVMEKNVRAERIVYTDAVKEALRNYMRNLQDGKDRLGERERHARKLLWGYGVGREDVEKGKVMREIARVYEELVREIREVGRDVNRLKGK